MIPEEKAKEIVSDWEIVYAGRTFALVILITEAIKDAVAEAQEADGLACGQAVTDAVEEAEALVRAKGRLLIQIAIADEREGCANVAGG